MKKFALTLGCALLAATLYAQPPAAPSPNETPQQQAIQKQAQDISLRLQLNYQKLQGLQEFQDYVADLAKLNQLQQQYQMAATAPKPPAKPAEPAKK